jgi:hypothetical protein
MLSTWAVSARATDRWRRTDSIHVLARNAYIDSLCARGSGAGAKSFGQCKVVGALLALRIDANTSRCTVHAGEGAIADT